MPFNGSGVYSPIGAPDFPAVAGTTVRASQYNNEVNDLATALTNCITRDGQSPWLANIPATGFKLTGLGAGVTAGDSVRYEQVALLDATFRSTWLTTTSNFAAAYNARLPQVSLQGGSANNRLDLLVDNSGATALMGLQAWNTAGSAADFVIYTGATTNNLEHFKVGSNGRITLTPANEAYALLFNYGPGVNGMYIGCPSSGVLSFSTSGGSERIRIDANGGLLLTNSTGLLGYGTGSGLSVTQSIAKNATITANKATGQITMSSAALAGGAKVTFQANCSLITAGTEFVTVSLANPITTGAYRVWVETIFGGAPGGFTVVLENYSGGSLSDAVVLRYVVLVSVNA